jgi:ankyrin repeat protein
MGTSVLQLALEMRGNDCAAVFLQNGADILSVNTNGQNAVHSAVIGGSSELVGQLLRAGAGADIPDIQGVTPLMIAAYTGNEKAIRILLDAGADTCRRDKRGRSADNLAKLSSKDWSANLKCKRRVFVHQS